MAEAYRQQKITLLFIPKTTAGDDMNDLHGTLETELYYGTKKVAAATMTRGEYNKYRGWDLPANENGSDDGYLVEYQDGGKPNMPNHAGYVSWSPKDVFENAYKSSGEMSFGHALIALQEGHKVARIGWNGKGMFLYYVPANAYPAQTETAKNYWRQQEGIKTHESGVPLVPYGAYIAMKTAQENVVPWLASQTDVLADDWAIVE